MSMEKVTKEEEQGWNAIKGPRSVRYVLSIPKMVLISLWLLLLTKQFMLRLDVVKAKPAYCNHDLLIHFFSDVRSHCFHTVFTLLRAFVAVPFYLQFTSRNLIVQFDCSG